MKLIPRRFVFWPTLLANVAALVLMWVLTGTIGTEDQLPMLAYQLVVLLVANEAWGHGVAIPALIWGARGDAAAGEARLLRLLRWTSPLLFTGPFLMSGMLWVVLNALDICGFDYPLIWDEFVGQWLSGLAGVALVWMAALFLRIVPVSCFLLLDADNR